MQSSAPWLAFYGKMPATISYPDKTMFQLVAQTAQQYAQMPAYEFMGKITTYHQLMANIQKAASAFWYLGIRPGDRVALCLPNLPQTVDAFYALNCLGAIPCMIHPLSAPEEMKHYLAMTQCKILLTLDILYDKVAGVLQELDSSCRPVVTGIAERLPTMKKWLYPFTKASQDRCSLPDSALKWHDVLKTPHQGSIPMSNSSVNDCGVILFSGGTTGKPKGICLSNGNMNALALQTIAASGCESIAGLSMLSVMPMFHGFGLGIGVHTALVGGAKCILVPRFTVESYAKLVKNKKPDFIPGVPTLFASLIKAKALKRADLSFLKGVFSGGDSLSIPLKKQVDAFLHSHKATVKIREGYGTTECVTASCLTPITKEKSGSIGIPFPDTYYKVVIPGTTQEVPPNTDGELCLTGPTVMLGYFNEPAETEAALIMHDDGKRWLHTGDLGHMDADGYVYFTQRIKRVIVTNGYNVYPAQIESALEEMPSVDQACVVGIADPVRGQRVVAFIVINSPVSSETLSAHCQRSIAKYALPKEFIFVDALPKTSVGKVAFQAVEELYHEIKRKNL